MVSPRIPRLQPWGVVNVNGHFTGGFNDGVFIAAQIGLYAEFDDASFTNYANYAVYPLN